MPASPIKISPEFFPIPSMCSERNLHEVALPSGNQPWQAGESTGFMAGFRRKITNFKIVYLPASHVSVPEAILPFICSIYPLNMFFHSITMWKITRWSWNLLPNLQPTAGSPWPPPPPPPRVRAAAARPSGWPLQSCAGRNAAGLGGHRGHRGPWKENPRKFSGRVWSITEYYSKPGGLEFKSKRKMFWNELWTEH